MIYMLSKCNKIVLRKCNRLSHSSHLVRSNLFPAAKAPRRERLGHILLRTTRILKNALHLFFFQFTALFLGHAFRGLSFGAFRL
ncbi:hypothetical protein Q31b_43810 [Novipirellula aureliae]|uniref:Uncharacterized protein n=1 Tax=Novipirellula aureliae TaxID=2527966 RepID=A0A5C6DJP2_9BACT|nr:hypothetical protein Q31b_43810 [Novipirellula aureliae]